MGDCSNVNRILYSEDCLNVLNDEKPLLPPLVFRQDAKLQDDFFSASGKGNTWRVRNLTVEQIVHMSNVMPKKSTPSIQHRSLESDVVEHKSKNLDPQKKIYKADYGNATPEQVTNAVLTYRR